MEDEANNYDGIASWYEKWCTGDEAYEQTLQFYLDYLKNQEGSFLELGIGTGRIALEIIRQQPKRIVGVDISKNMLEQCERKYLQLKLRNELHGSLELVHERMENISFHQEFQTVYLPFRTVGHLLTDEKLELLFLRVYQALRPDGIFVLDHYIFQKEWAVEHNDIDIIMYEDEKEIIADHYIYDFNRGLMDCSIKRNDVIVQKFMFRWIEPATINKIAKKTGFVVQSIYGDFDKRPWNHESVNQIWVLRK